MTFKLSLALAASMAVMSATAHDALAETADECWSGRTYMGEACLRATSEWNGDAFVVEFRNRCEGRIYVRACNEKTTDYNDCGSFGIRGYSEYRHRTGMNATGRYRYRWTGSENASEDWLCADRDDRWNDDMF